MVLNFSALSVSTSKMWLVCFFQNKDLCSSDVADDGLELTGPRNPRVHVSWATHYQLSYMPNLRTFIFNYVYFFCVGRDRPAFHGAHVWQRMPQCVCGDKGQPTGAISLPRHVIPGALTHVRSLGSRCLYPLSHLNQGGPKTIFTLFSCFR